MNKSESKYFNTAQIMDDALVELLENKDFEYITVKELCDEAGVNRSTFYLHYESMADLLEETLERIEVFPEESKNVDVMDVYHLWVFPKGFSLPCGIHPTKDKQCKAVNRGYPKDISHLVANSKDIMDIK